MPPTANKFPSGLYLTSEIDLRTFSLFKYFFFKDFASYMYNSPSLQPIANSSPPGEHAIVIPSFSITHEFIIFLLSISHTPNNLSCPTV